MALLGSNNPQLTAMIHGEIRVLREQALQRIADELTLQHGNVKATAKKLRISRATLNRYINEFPELAIALRKIRKELLE